MASSSNSGNRNINGICSLGGVKQIRDEFQDRTWQAFWQTAVEQREMKDVAKRLEMNVGALYVARNRVISRLRNVIADEIGEQL